MHLFGARNKPLRITFSSAVQYFSLMGVECISSLLPEEKEVRRRDSRQPLGEKYATRSIYGVGRCGCMPPATDMCSEWRAHVQIAKKGSILCSLKDRH